MTLSRWPVGAVRRGGAAVAAALVLAPPPAPAAELRLVPSVLLQESFSDNANLATDEDDRNSDLVTVVTPGVSATMQGGRVNGGLNYGRSETISRTGASDSSAQNNLLATGQAELWDRVVFVDTQASITRQVVDNAQPTSNSLATDESNKTTTRTFNLSPFFLHHFGTWAETRSRITYSQVSTETDEVEDTSELNESFTINSGRRFSSFLWSATALNNRTASEDQSARNERSVTGNGTYVLDSRYSLIGSVGWQELQDSTLDDPPKGITWSAGFAAQPGQKTSLRFTAGEEDDSRTFNFEGTYRLSQRTAITATYNQQLQTSQQALSNGLSFLGVNSAGELIDTRTNEPFSLGNDGFGLQNSTFLQRNFSLRLSGSRRRNSFSAEFEWESRKTDTTGIEEGVWTTTVNLTRVLSQRSRGGITLAHAYTDFGNDANATQREVTLGLTYSYQLLQDVQLSLAYNLTVRNVNNQDGDFYENAVTMGASKSF